MLFNVGKSGELDQAEVMLEQLKERRGDPCGYPGGEHSREKSTATSSSSTRARIKELYFTETGLQLPEVDTSKPPLYRGGKNLASPTKSPQQAHRELK